MILTSSLETFGRYCLFIKRVLTIPDKWKEFFKRTSLEITKLGVNSIPLVLIIAVFIGAVIAIQMQLNIMSPLIPSYAVGMCTRETVLLEFSSSILGLILAGKVGSNIVSEIGTMRVTEQIDALEIMGINSCNFLVLPKVVAFLIYMPILVIFCMVSSLYGGYLVSVFTDLFPASRYIYGIQSMFTEWYVWYGLIKSLFFSFVITTVAAFFGYYVKGGALQVGKASTNAVVTSSIIILLLDVALTNLLLK
jgi:phospholipid/cholesterol/gamma-HCH transport system permease protein